MAANDIPSGYWNGPRPNRKCPAARAERISKTAWMDLYFDLYAQTHGEADATQEAVIADAENRLRILKQNNIRR